MGVIFMILINKKNRLVGENIIYIIKLNNGFIYKINT